jgi:hypothetical protein
MVIEALRLSSDSRITFLNDLQAPSSCLRNVDIYLPLEWHNPKTNESMLTRLVCLSVTLGLMKALS